VTSINANGGCSLEQYAELKRLPMHFLQDLGLTDCKYGWLPAIAIPYRDTEDTERAIRYRTALRKAGVDHRFKWKKGSTPFLYGLWRLRPGEPVVIVEIESDCHTLWFHRINAVGQGSAIGKRSGTRLPWRTARASAWSSSRIAAARRRGSGSPSPKSATGRA
jgi:hypothetical protein